MQPLPDRLPLVIGVTGHRDLRDQDLPMLEEKVAAIIERLRRDYLGTDGETPIIIISSLAEGADRLVARVGLAQGAWLVAPMPMPVEEYRRDFEPGLKPGNAAEFDSLLAQAIAAPVMPFMPGNSLAAVRSDQQKRGEQYRAVGLFIVQHCNVLIALWDGDDANPSAGGTAEVVAFKRRGIPPAVSGSARASLDASEIGPVIHVVTPRQVEAGAASAVAVRDYGRAIIRRVRGGWASRLASNITGVVAHLFRRHVVDVATQVPAAERRELAAWETFEALVALTRQFNREASAIAVAADGPARVAKNLDMLIGAAAQTGIEPAAAKACALERAARWCRLYAIADTLAQERQVEFRLDWRLIFTLSYVALVCFAFSGHAGIASSLLLGGYSLAFMAIFVLFLRARWQAHQERFLDYRALAEALRVAIFWKIVGIDTAVDDQALLETNFAGVLAGSYPIQPSELNWVKDCLRATELLDRAEHAAPRQRPDSLGHAIARGAWVHDQFAFFARQGSRHQQLADAINAWAMLLLFVTPFTLVPLLMLAFDAAREHGGELRGALMELAGLVPALAVTLMGYSEHLALHAQAHQYDRMRLLFGRAYELLPENVDDGNAALARSFYAELGREAMKENAEWVAIYRQRPIQPT